jgi:cob(I)alamin adenosyltransferase
MKIYTKTGDAGTTSLIGGKRVKKNNLRIESYGTVDELNSYIGLIKDQKGIGNNDKNSLLKIQNELFTIGAMLATDPDKETLKNGQERVSIPKIDRHSILFLENEIDKMDEKLPQMTHFILPGGHQTVSFCHIARCVCRRAERLSVELNEKEKVSNELIIYLNRLSDFLFTLARKLSKELLVDEIKWIPKKKS